MRIEIGYLIFLFVTIPCGIVFSVGTIHSLCLSIGVALCVMSVIPPIIIDALNFEILDDLGMIGERRI